MESEWTLFDLEQDIRNRKHQYALCRPSGLCEQTKSRNMMGALALHLVEVSSSAPNQNATPTTSCILASPQEERARGGEFRGSPTPSESSMRRNNRCSNNSPVGIAQHTRRVSQDAGEFRAESPVAAFTGGSVEDEAESSIAALDSLEAYLSQCHDETDRRKQRNLVIGSQLSEAPAARLLAVFSGASEVPNVQKAPTAAGGAAKTSSSIRRGRTSFVGV